MTAARQLLQRLLAAAERDQAAGRSGPARIPLTRTKCPSWHAMRSLAEAEAFRAELAVAERQGGIAIETDRRASPPRDLVAIRLADLGRLAALLGIETRAARLAHARAVLGPWLAQHPVLSDVLDAWSAGRQVRREEPTADAVAGLCDAAQVLSARSGASDEVLLRRESIRLFGDSKRIEAIARWIVLLHGAELAPVDLEPEEAFAALGLVREPQPFLVSGTTGSAQLRGAALPLIRPYIGLPLHEIAGFRFDQMPGCVLSIENKQTFHELAMHSSAADTLLLYTAGMPSPAWRLAYAKLLCAIPPGATRVHHFGDIDVGGFRIAAAIAKSAQACGHQLHPWRMDPEAIARNGVGLRPATASQASAMERWARACGWTELAEGIRRHPALLEQEALTPATVADCQ